jgi:hypothetical protein
MSRTVIVLLLVLLMALGANLSGQEVKGKTDGKQPAKSTVPAKRIYMPHVYLGNSDYKGGPIPKKKFDSLMKQGLTSRDSLGNLFRVIGYDFTYAERKLYEDSVGSLGVYMDYSSEHCFGDTLSRHMSSSGDTLFDGEVSQSLYDRCKTGDTIYFDHVRIVRYQKNSKLTFPDSTAIAGKGLKCVIVK